MTGLIIDPIDGQQGLSKGWGFSGQIGLAIMVKRCLE